jgi:hypothetical protein
MRNFILSVVTALGLALSCFGQGGYIQGPPGGPASGELQGTYPNPLVNHNAVLGSVTDILFSAPGSVAVSGRYAYVAANSGNALTVVDVINPTTPVVVGTVTGASLTGAMSVAVLGSYAYVACSTGDALTVVNITNPAIPVVSGTVTAASLTGAMSVAVFGNYAYVAAYGANALTVVNVTNPVAPVVSGTVTAASLNGPYSVALLGNYAYVAAYGANSLTVVDVTLPAAPAVFGTITDPTLAGPVAVAVSGTFAYVAVGTNALTAVDISVPAVPALGGTIKDAQLLRNPSGVAIYNNSYVAVTSYTNALLTVVNVQNPFAPIISGSVAIGTADPSAIAVVGSLAYVTSATANTLTVLNLFTITSINRPSLESILGFFVRPTLNLLGPGVACVDNPTDAQVDCTFAGGAGGHVIQTEGVPLPAEPNLNFQSTGVTCADDPGNTATVCTIPGGTAGAANYSKPFVAAGSLTITNAEHTFGHANLIVSCYDNSAPPQLFEPALVTVDPATYEVVATFAGTPTGHCVVNGGSGASTAIPEWRKYALVAIANGVNGCANANGCWQINGVLGANKAAGFTQDVVLAALGARWQLTDWRIKTNTACTGTTTALSGLGTTGNNVLFRPQTYDIAPAASNTNLSTGPTAGAGADTAAATNLIASLITTVQNVDQLVAGCAVDYWAMWAVLP